MTASQPGSHSPIFILPSSYLTHSHISSSLYDFVFPLPSICLKNAVAVCNRIFCFQTAIKNRCTLKTQFRKPPLTPPKWRGFVLQNHSRSALMNFSFALSLHTLHKTRFPNLPPSGELEGGFRFPESPPRGRFRGGFSPAFPLRGNGKGASFPRLSHPAPEGRGRVLSRTFTSCLTTDRKKLWVA